jgi:DNA repair exonuclease SbcCD ATPase subunit
LENLATTLDAESIGKLGEGLLATASFLDEKVAPAAGMAADQLDASTGLLRDDALRLAALLRESPPDFKAVQEIHDGLARFSEGLNKMSEALKLQRFETMKEGVKGLETSLTTGAEQVEKLSGYTYPVVTFNGIKPMVDQRPFWPEGTTIAKGMRQASEGVAAAGKEMDGLAAELPKLRLSLEESRKVADRSREALALALKQREKVEPLLKNVPEHAARLAEELPKLGADLAKILRETQKLKDIAAQMRMAHKGLESAVARWPQLRDTLNATAKLLKATQVQLKQVVDRREEYEKAMAETVEFTDEFAERLPAYTEHINGQLEQHEKSFEGLQQSVDEVSNALPVYANTAERMVQATRLLLLLVAGIVGLHAGYLMVSVRLGKQFSP